MAVSLHRDASGKMRASMLAVLAFAATSSADGKPRCSCVCILNKGAPISSKSAVIRQMLIPAKCSVLAHHETLQGKVLMPDTAGYNARLKTYYSANAAQHAWCMVLPESTHDVQAVARIISKHGCSFGIKAGAHSAWKGSNGVEQGITVDFGMLNLSI